MNGNVTAVLQSLNKAIGAVVGGGVIALLVGLHAIPAGVGNTLLAILGAAAAVIGAFLAPPNKPINTDPGIGVDEDGGPLLTGPVDGHVDQFAELTASDGTATNHLYDEDDDGHPLPYPHGKQSAAG